MQLGSYLGAREDGHTTTHCISGRIMHKNFYDVPQVSGLCKQQSHQVIVLYRFGITNLPAILKKPHQGIFFKVPLGCRNRISLALPKIPHKPLTTWNYLNQETLKGGLVIRLLMKSQNPAKLQVNVISPFPCFHSHTRDSLVDNYLLTTFFYSTQASFSTLLHNIYELLFPTLPEDPSSVLL